MRTTTTHRPRTTSRNRRLLRLAALALVAGTSFAACASEADDDALRAAETDDTVADEATDTSDGGDAQDGAQSGTSGQAATSGGQTGSGGGQSGSSGGGQPGGGQPASSAPVITAFVTPDSIDCHNGPFQTFTASWSTTNAVKVTISIDGPGIYDTYGPSGEASLPFSCSSSHTFLLTAHGADGSTVSRSVTLEPRNVQPDGGEDEES